MTKKERLEDVRSKGETYRMSWKDDKPTYKQLNYIKFLEDDYGVKFNGNTKGEASDFIDKCYKDFRIDLRNEEWNHRKGE